MHQNLHGKAIIKKSNRLFFLESNKTHLQFYQSKIKASFQDLLVPNIWLVFLPFPNTARPVSKVVLESLSIWISSCYQHYTTTNMLDIGLLQLSSKIRKEPGMRKIPINLLPVLSKVCEPSVWFLKSSPCDQENSLKRFKSRLEKI